MRRTFQTVSLRTRVNKGKKWKGRGYLSALLAVEGFHYRWRDVGVVVHYLPSSSFTTVDVRHTPINAYRLVCELRLAMFGAQGVRYIASCRNHYQVFRRHLPIREYQGSTAWH